MPPAIIWPTQVRVGDILEVSAPRGSFVLRPGERPIVLISAGIGVTPVLAMLHALAAEPSARQVWWLHGARSGNEHPFAEEARRLIRSLPHCRSYVQYSQPRREDQPGVALRCTRASRSGVAGAPRRWPGRGFLSVRANAHFCGTLPRAWPPGASLLNECITEIFGPGKASAPGIVQASRRSPHPPAGSPGPGPRVSFARSGLEVSWDPAFKQPARTRGGLRCAGPMVLPHRSLSHLRERPYRGRGQLRPRASRTACRRQSFNLLFPPSRGRHSRPVMCKLQLTRKAPGPERGSILPAVKPRVRRRSRAPRALPRPPCRPRPPPPHSVSPSRSARRRRQKCPDGSSPAERANGSSLSRRARRRPRGRF